MAEQKTVFDFIAQDLDGNIVELNRFRGNVLLIVNTASKGTTKKKLKKLNLVQEVFHGRPFQLLAFPCSQIMNRERHSSKKIYDYYIAKKDYKLNVFSRVKVNGSEAHPLFKWLKAEKGGDIHTNFNKFLCSYDGKVVTRFGGSTSWTKLMACIEKEVRKCEEAHMGQYVQPEIVYQTENVPFQAPQEVTFIDVGPEVDFNEEAKEEELKPVTEELKESKPVAEVGLDEEYKKKEEVPQAIVEKVVTKTRTTEIKAKNKKPIKVTKVVTEKRMEDDGSIKKRKEKSDFLMEGGEQQQPVE